MPYVVALAVALVGVGLWVVGSYNALVRLRRLVARSWQQVDDDLRRRYDIVPNLVETVERHEVAGLRELLGDVVDARTASVAAGASVTRRSIAEDTLVRALDRLFDASLSHPALLADESFRALRDELADTQHRIAAGRRIYNANVRRLNTTLRGFPARLVAAAVGVSRGESFQMAESSA
jgi:LemA protein